MTRPPGAAAGAVAFAVVLAVTAAQVSVLASLDEAVYKVAAVNFADAFPSALSTDPVSRGAARLYSLLLAPLFAVLEGDQAVRAGRALNGVLWAATALPVYWIGRRVVASPAAAAAAAVLAVAVPWATLSLILFSESLSYLLFAFTMLAMLRALEEPSWRRDAIALAAMAVLVTARMQFAVVPFAWLAVVAALEWRRGARRDPRSAFARHPVTFGLVALGVLAFGVLLVSGVLRDLTDRVGGPYSALQDRRSLPTDAGLALLAEVGLLALGVGIVAAVLAGAWYRDALRGRLGEPALRLALLSGVVVAVLFATTVWAQGGWLDAKTEERYYIYAVPFVWIGAVAALALPDLTAWRMLGGGLVLAAILFLVPVTVPTTGEQMFLGPVSGIVADATPRVDGRLRDLLDVDAAITRRDLAGWTAVLVAIGGALLWRRRRTAALGLSVALQTLLVLYALAGVHGRMEPIPGVLTDRPFSDIGWVDRSLPDGADAAIAQNAGVSADVDVLHGVFWNDRIRSRVGLAGDPYQPPYPANLLPVEAPEPGRDGALLPLRTPFVVAARDSAQWQLGGRAIASTRDRRLALLDVGEAPRAVWIARGLDADGHATQRVQLNALGGRRYAIAFAPPARDASGRVRVRLGDVDRSVEHAPGGPRQVVDVDLCGETGMVRGSIDLVSAVAQVSPGRYSASRVPSVRVERC